MDRIPEIRLIVSDVEGCITPPNRGIMDPSQLLPIARYCKACREGAPLPPLVLCTGRQIPYVEAVSQMIGAFFPGFPSIAENGAFLYDVAKNEVIENPAITPDAHVSLAEVRRAIAGLMSRHGAKKEYGKEHCVSLNAPQGMSIEGLYRIAQEALAPWAAVVEITHSMSAVDITPAGVDKGSGLRHLSERTGIAFDHMLGIGDTKGDWPMLKLVGTPTAPANATDDVRAIAKDVATEPGPLGVAEILARYTSWKQ